jgi:hypothetical protein
MLADGQVIIGDVIVMNPLFAGGQYTLTLMVQKGDVGNKPAPLLPTNVDQMETDAILLIQQAA